MYLFYLSLDYHSLNLDVTEVWKLCVHKHIICHSESMPFCLKIHSFERSGHIGRRALTISVDHLLLQLELQIPLPPKAAIGTKKT